MTRVLLALAAALSLPVVASAQGAPPPTRPDSAAAAPGTRSILREVFTYADRGRRDPMVSLMNSADLRPMLQDLQLIGLMYDASGQGSLATLRDLTDKTKLYRVRVGQTLGRMQVTAITPRDIEFVIEEFGFSRRERLALKPDSLPPRAP